MKLEVQELEVSTLNNYHKNPRRGDVSIIAESLRVNGQYKPIVVNEGTKTDRALEVLAGNHTLKAAKAIGWKTIQAVIVDVNDAEAARIVLADNKSSDVGKYDDEVLQELLESLIEDDFGLMGSLYDDDDLANMILELSEVEEIIENKVTLKEEFGFNPVSVLDTTDSLWQKRNKEWRDWGVQSEFGRENSSKGAFSKNRAYSNWYKVKKYAEEKEQKKLTNNFILIHEEYSKLLSSFGGTNSSSMSVFNSALCEIIIKLYSKKGDKIIDPWAGGSVRGLVSSKLERKYTGIDLSKQQCEANVNNLKVLDKLLDKKYHPKWINGDANKELGKLEEKFDFMVACPPYYDLEVYSDDKADLSNMSYEDFDKSLAETAELLYDLMNDNRFLVMIVGDVRDKDGNIRSMYKATLNAFEGAGFNFSQDAILKTFANLQNARNYVKNRTLTRNHQYVMVFTKGKKKEAVKRLGKIDNLLIIGEADE